MRALIPLAHARMDGKHFGKSSLIIVDKCPHCGHEHSHSGDADNDHNTIRTADCDEGDYILYFENKAN